MSEDLFSHDEALRRLAGDPTHCAFAFFPKHSAGEISGGVFFFLELGESKPLLRAFQGRFFSGEAKTGVYDDEEADRHAALFLQVFGVDPRTLSFKACAPAQIETAVHHAIERNVSILNGFETIPQSERDISPEWEALLLQHLPTKEFL